MTAAFIHMAYEWFWKTCYTTVYHCNTHVYSKFTSVNSEGRYWRMYEILILKKPRTL